MIEKSWAAGILALVAAVGQTSSFAADLVWRQPADPGGRVPSQIGVGDYGGQVFAGYRGANGFVRLTSAFDTSPATAVWSSAPVFDVQVSAVASAPRAPLHSWVTRERSSATAPLKFMLRVFGSSSAQPLWSYQLPVAASGIGSCGVQFTADGSRIISWAYSWDASKTIVSVHTPGSAAPTQTFWADTSLPPTTALLVGDGGAILFVTPYQHLIVDTTGGQTLMNVLVPAGCGPHVASSADGTRLACAIGGGIVQLYQRSASTFVPSVQFPSPPSTSTWTSVALSPDANTLAFAAYDVVQAGSAKLRVFDLSLPEHPQTAAIDLTQGAPGSSIAELRFLQDGSLLAGTSGPTTGLPGLLGFCRSGSSWALDWTESLDSGVSCLAVPSSGKRIALVEFGFGPPPGNAPLHSTRCYELGSPDLRVSGAPRANQSVALLARGTPGTGAVLLGSPALATNPMYYPGIGSLFLDPWQLQRQNLGTFDAQGRIERSLPITGPPGTERFYQLFSLAPRRLGSGILAITVLP